MMRSKLYILLVMAAALLAAQCSKPKIDTRWAMNRNVCKKLKGDVLIYAIFVDTKGSLWTEKDLKSTLDSLNEAANWLNKQAKENNIELNVQVAHFNKSKTILKDLPKSSLEASLKNPTEEMGTKKVNGWADDVAKRVGAVLPQMPADSFPHVNQPKDKERLIARLRDEYNVESVALYYILSPTKKEDNNSVVVNTMSNKDVEYTITTYRYPSVFCYQFLQLFGAASLLADPNERPSRNQELALKEFPDDVMVTPGRPLKDLTISSFTKYTIGWTNDLDPKYYKLLKEDEKQ